MPHTLLPFLDSFVPDGVYGTKLSEKGSNVCGTVCWLIGSRA